jgi:hypothetical protein
MTGVVLLLLIFAVLVGSLVYHLRWSDKQFAEHRRRMARMRRRDALVPTVGGTGAAGIGFGDYGAGRDCAPGGGYSGGYSDAGFGSGGSGDSGGGGGSGC